MFVLLCFIVWIGLFIIFRWLFNRFVQPATDRRITRDRAELKEVEKEFVRKQGWLKPVSFTEEEIVSDMNLPFVDLKTHEFGSDHRIPQRKMLPGCGWLPRGRCFQEQPMLKKEKEITDLMNKAKENPIEQD